MYRAISFSPPNVRYGLLLLVGLLSLIYRELPKLGTYLVYTIYDGIHNLTRLCIPQALVVKRVRLQQLTARKCALNSRHALNKKQLLNKLGGKQWAVLSLLPKNRSFNMAERQASTLESLIRGSHIYKQIWRPLLGREREEGYNHDNSLSVFPSMLLSLDMFFESFRGCFGTSSGRERPSLVN